MAGGLTPPGWRAAGGELDLPPPHQHPDEPETRPDLPHAAAVLAELAVGQANEAVAAWLGQHALEQRSRLGLAASPLGERRTSVVKALDELVAQRLELRDAQHPGAAAGVHPGVQRGDGKARG